jgi:hypothetical protein
MPDDTKWQPQEDSMRAQIGSLPPGGCFSRSVLVRAQDYDADAILGFQRALRATVYSAMARARAENVGHAYSMHGAHALTQGLDVLVTVAVVRDR